jgi:HlyD family secretion protein
MSSLLPPPVRMKPGPTTAAVRLIPRKSSVKKLLWLLVLVFCLAGVAAWWANPTYRAMESQEGYSFAPAEHGNLIESISASGPISPRDYSPVGSELSGKVIKIFPNADYARHVEKGDPLLELDHALADDKLAMAKVAVKLAKANEEAAIASRDAAEVAYKNWKDKFAKEIATTEDRDKADYQLKAATAMRAAARVKVEEAEEAVKQAQLGVDYSTVRAPISGTIIDRKVNNGQLIGPPVSAQLFVIVKDMKDMQVNAQIPESDIGKIRTGMEATFTVYSFSDLSAPFTGKVSQIRQMPNTAAQEKGAVFYTTVVEAENRRNPASTDLWMLLPGMTASVDIRLREHKNTWKAPAAAVSLQIDESFQDEAARKKLHEWQTRKDASDWKPVWIMKDKKPYPIFIRLGGKNPQGETGIKDGQYQEILEWDPDPELTPRPDPNKPETIPQLIIAAPPARKPGLFGGQTLRVGQ